MSALIPVDRDASSVVSALESAHRFLSTAVEMTGAVDVALVKTQIAMAETYSRELHLSKDIRDQALEMVRRAEWALEQAIKRDRDAGVIKGLHSGRGVHVPGVRGMSSRSETDQLDDRPRARDFFSSGEERSQVYQIGQASEGEFEAALVAAKAEGNLSRANIVRKVKQQTSPQTRDSRADLIEDLAAQGYSVRQMPGQVGIGEEAIRRVIRDYDIDVPAERSVGRTRRHDSARIASETVIALEGLAMGVELIDYTAIDPAQAGQWADSLAHSFRTLNRFRKQIKETTQ